MSNAAEGQKIRRAGSSPLGGDWGWRGSHDILRVERKDGGVGDLIGSEVSSFILVLILR